MKVHFFSQNFGKLVVQSNGGRMKPLSTLNREIIQKLSGKASMLGMTSDQLILGMLSTPDVWKDVKMIKIQTPKLKKFLGVDEKEKYIAFSEVFKDGELTAREKSLIALAVSHTVQCPYCIDAYTQDALEKGATEKGMMEAVHVAAAIRGGASLVHGVMMMNKAKKLSM